MSADLVMRAAAPAAIRRPRAPRARRLASLALAGIPLLLGACDWFTDFKDQPRLEPWESVAGDTVPFRGNPAGSVPIYGNTVPVYRVSYDALPATIDSMSSIPNPTPPDSASLARGHKYFAINCAVCHGFDGAGSKVQLIQKYGLAVSLQSESAKSRSDGYIFGMIRNGRGLMPTYDRIEEMDRWDVVNYVKALQGRLGVTVPTGPVGQPGETGATLPGYTVTSPTRPAPHYSLTPIPAADLSMPGQSRPAGDRQGAAVDTTENRAAVPNAGVTP